MISIPMYIDSIGESIFYVKKFPSRDAIRPYIVFNVMTASPFPIFFTNLSSAVIRVAPV